MTQRVQRSLKTFQIWYLLFFIALVLTWVSGDALSDRTRFIAYTGFLLVYLMIEICRTFVTDKVGRLINPVVLASIATFGLQFGITNFMYGPHDEFLAGLLGERAYYWMSQAMLYVLLGAFAMWRGFRSQMGVKMAVWLWSWLLSKGILRQKLDIRWPFIVLCLVVSLSCRLFQTSLGVFGYSSEMEQLYQLAAFRMYLDIGSSLSRLALFGLALSYFARTHYHPVHHGVLIFVLFFEITFGFLAGFKGQTVMPLIILGLAYYSIKRRLPKGLMVTSVFLIFFAFSIIEPFRRERNSDASFETRNIKSIGAAIWKQTKKRELSLASANEIFSEYYSSFLGRLNIVPMAARAIQHKEEHGLSQGAPRFLKRVLLSPVYAWVPRLLWPTKPTGDLGLWFSIKVIGMPPTTKSSTGMSPISYLYFAGGWLGIFLGFFVIGMLQRILYAGLWFAGVGSFIIFWGLAHPFIEIDSAVDGIFVTLFRFFPLLLIAQRLLFKR